LYGSARTTRSEDPLGKHADDRDGDVHEDTAKKIKPEDFEEPAEPAEDDDDD